MVLVVLAALALAPVGQSATTQTRAERSLVEAVNDVRDAHNLRPLRIDPALVRAARGYSASMLRRNVFEHGSFADRIVRQGARGPALGENLAWGVGRRASARRIVGAWMNSPGHRENLLRPGWDRIGIGALKGRFLGVRGATVVTADFAGS
ncbi:MAG: hypothetical protein QOF45_288 [Gaiellaceae bacterium]|nr:hypothetical protein [Gaiellaceae bacterium]